MSHRLANEFSQSDKFTEKVVDTQAPFASRNACISLGETRALRAFSTSWKLFWKIDRWCHLNINWSFLQKRFEPFEFLVHSLLVPTLVSCWCVELFTWVWFSRVLFTFFNRSFHVYNIAVFTDKFTKTAWKMFILSFIPLAKSNFELLVFTLYYYLELLPETQWVPGIKFKEKINECLCERPFEKGNAVVVGRKRGGGVFWPNLFEGERRLYKDGIFYVKPEMLKTGATFPFKYMKNSVSRTFCLEWSYLSLLVEKGS